VTGVGKVDELSGNPEVNVTSTFFIIPQNEQFHDSGTNSITFKDSIPISNLSAQDMKMSLLIGSWGHNAVLAYAVKEFENIKVVKNIQPDKLEKLKNLVYAVRNKMEKDDDLYEPASSLLANIEKLSAEKNIEKQP
jgi:hypothetical protein